MATAVITLPDTVLAGLVEADVLHVQETRDGVGRRYDLGTHSVPLAVCGVWLAEGPPSAEELRAGRPCGLCLDQLRLKCLPRCSS